MATITTTIREPKTFQQIQDQQNELGKNQTLESLNDNISKLIKAITDRDQKRETEQDRQLKMNQLELSKLQLRRAQLGLAKDEKYYSDYSRKWSEKNNFGTSIGLDRNTSGNIGAIGVSALTAGALNPVIVKNLLFPIMTPLMNVTKALATFPGLLPGLFHRTSGKSSSAVASDPDRRLHGKLDQILGAIKDKTKSSITKEEKEQSMLSKFLNALLLGAAGMFAASELFGKPKNEILSILKDYGPAMVAGYALGGWKGALVAGGLVLGYRAWKDLIGETQKTPEQIEDENKALAKINSYIPVDFLKFKNMGHFKATVAGLMIGGLKGAAAGWAFGKYADTIKKWIGKLPSDDSDQDSENENEDTWLNTLATTLGLNTPESVLPVLAGFYLKGIHGAVFGYLSGQILKEVDLAKQYREAIQRGDEIEAQKIKEDMEDTKYRSALSGALAGFMTGGVGGAIVGGMLSFFTAELAEAYTLSGTWSGAFGQMLDRPILGVPSEVWMGTLSLTALAIKGKLGWQGILAAAAIGALGGFVADRYRSKELIEEIGFEAEWDKLGYKIKGTDLTIEQVRQEARDNLIKAGKVYTDKDIQKETQRLLKEKYNVLNKRELENQQRNIDYNNLNTQVTQIEYEENQPVNKEEFKKRGILQTLSFWKSDEDIIKENLEERKEEIKKQKDEVVKNFLDRLEKDGIIVEVEDDDSSFITLIPKKEMLKGGEQILRHKGLSKDQIDVIKKASNYEDLNNEDTLLLIESVKIMNPQKEQEYNDLKQREEKESYQDKERRKKSEEANIEMNEREKENEKKQQPQLVIGDQSSSNEFSGPTSHGSDKYD